MKILGSKGFTLIEVLVSILILAVTSIILYQSWNGSLNAIRKGRNYNTVFLLLQRKVTEFEVESRTKKIDELKDSDEGDFGSSYPDFSWQIKLQPFVVPPINPPKKKNDVGTTQITETVFKVISGYFEKAVREVLITVNYKANGKTLKYSVSTIYVDYTQPLPTGF
jgi:prepilin-type N-terminal cleavage/methylation domain-containing protein